MKNGSGVVPSVVEEPADQIIAEVAASNVPISRSQLERWHKVGAIPRPRQVTLPGLGSTTYYPPGTTQLVLALCDVRQRERSLLRAAWTLWLAGHAVPMVTVRSFLMSVVRWHDRLLGLLQSLGFAGEWLTTAALRLVRRWAVSRDAGSLRQRVGGADRAETVTRVGLQIALGTYDAELSSSLRLGPSDDEGLLVEDAVGLTSGRTDRIRGVGPWLTGDATQVLGSVGELAGGPWEPLAIDLTDVELIRARDDLIELRYLTSRAAAALAEMYGPNAFGFPAIAAVLNSPSSMQTAILILFLARVRRSDDPSLTSGLDTLLEQARIWRDKWEQQISLLRSLREEVPALREALSPARMRHALENDDAYAEYTTELQRIAERERPMIEAALARIGARVNSQEAFGGRRPE